MYITRQTGSLEDYLSLFEERVAQLPELPTVQYLGMFLGGLQPSIRDSIPDSELSDVFAPIRSACHIARVTQPPTMNNKPISGIQLRSTTTSVSSGGNGNNSTDISVGNLSGMWPGQSASHSSYGFPSPNRNIRNLPPEEAHEYRAKGLCYRFRECFGPLHKCTAKHLSVIIGSDDDKDGHVYSELNSEDFKPSFEVQP